MRDFVEKLLFDIELDEANNELGITRDILPEVQLTKDFVVTIQGVRRSGKSTFMQQLIRKNNLAGEAFFINFEDPRLSDLLDYKLLDEIVEFHEKKKKRNYYYFFDEIQNVKDWEKWLHIQLGKKKRHFIISGSNSTLLAGQLGSALTGRHLSIELFPFNYNEFYQYTGKNLSEYLVLGGFPLALSVDKPKPLLRDYFVDIIERDVRRNIAFRSPKTLPQLAKCIFESAGSETSYRNLARTFDTTADSIKTYIDALESSYLVLSCGFFTYSEKKSLVHPKKYYPIDLGLKNAIITKTGQDHGKNLETIVFHSLRKKYHQVYYWKNKGEVDFVVETQDGIQPIQVTTDVAQSRHLKALEEFKSQYPKSLAPIFITLKNVKEYI